MNPKTLRPAGCFAVAAALLCAGCAPKIFIHHQDPTHNTVVVTVDGVEEDELDFDEQTSVSVSAGQHIIKVTPKGVTACPWTEDGAPWVIWVDHGATLTLLPPSVKTPSQNQVTTAKDAIPAGAGQGLGGK